MMPEHGAGGRAGGEQCGKLPQRHLPGQRQHLEKDDWTSRRQSRRPWRYACGLVVGFDGLMDFAAVWPASWRGGASHRWMGTDGLICATAGIRRCGRVGATLEDFDAPKPQRRLRHRHRDSGRVTAPSAACSSPRHAKHRYARSSRDAAALLGAAYFSDKLATMAAATSAAAEANGESKDEFLVRYAQPLDASPQL